MSNIYEPLLWYDASDGESKFIPALATSYSKSTDGLRWTFHLRDKVKFHDGQICDANAVKISIERTKEIGEGAGFIWGPLEYIEIVDELTIVFHLKYSAPLDLIVSAQYGAWIYSPRLAEMNRDSIRIGFAAGTGPYMLSKWVQNQNIILEANDDYWRGFSEKSFRKINLRVISEPATRIQMIKGGDADICSLIPIEALSSFDQHPELEVRLFPSFVNHFLILNVDKPPTNDIRIRQAIASALDYQSIIDNIYNGVAIKPTGLIPQSLSGISPPEKRYKFDLKIAEKLVEQSEIDKEHSIKLSYVASSNEYWKTCIMLQENCRKIGLRVDLHAGLWSEIWSNARTFETSPNIIEMAWWPTYASPSDWFFNMFGTQDPPLFNLSYYSNTTVDSLIQVAKKMEATHREKSFEIYSEIQSTLINDFVVIPIADLNAWIITKKNLIGFRNNPAYATILFHGLERSSN
jgi:peptide/nickel transport system substrate-binding protein